MKGGGDVRRRLSLLSIMVYTWSLVNSAPFDVLVARELSVRLHKRQATSEGYPGYVASSPQNLPNQYIASQYGIKSSNTVTMSSYNDQDNIAASSTTIPYGQQQLATQANAEASNQLPLLNYSSSTNSSNIHPNGSTPLELIIAETQAANNKSNNTYPSEMAMETHLSNTSADSYPVYYVTGDVNLDKEAQSSQLPANATSNSSLPTSSLNNASQTNETAPYPVYYVGRGYNNHTPEGTAKNRTTESPANLTMETSKDTNASSYPIYYLSTPAAPQSGNFTHGENTDIEPNNNTGVTNSPILYTYVNRTSGYESPSTGSPPLYVGTNTSSPLQAPASPNSNSYSTAVPTASSTNSPQPTTYANNYTATILSQTSSQRSSETPYPPSYSIPMGNSSYFASNAPPADYQSYSTTSSPPASLAPQKEYGSYSNPPYSPPSVPHPQEASNSYYPASTTAQTTSPTYQSAAFPSNLPSTAQASQAASYYTGSTTAPGTYPATGAALSSSQAGITQASSSTYLSPSPAPIQPTNISNPSVSPPSPPAPVIPSKLDLAYENASYIIASPPASPAVLFLPSPSFPLSEGFPESPEAEGRSNTTSNETMTTNVTISGTTTPTNNLATNMSNVSSLVTSTISPHKQVNVSEQAPIGVNTITGLPSVNIVKGIMPNISISTTTAQTATHNATSTPSKVANISLPTPMGVQPPTTTNQSLESIPSNITAVNNNLPSKQGPGSSSQPPSLATALPKIPDTPVPSTPLSNKPPGAAISNITTAKVILSNVTMGNTSSSVHGPTTLNSSVEITPQQPHILQTTKPPPTVYKALITTPTTPPPPVFYQTKAPPNSKSRSRKLGFGDKYLASQNQRARHRNVMFDGIGGDSMSFSRYQVLSQQEVFFPRNVNHLGRKRRSIPRE